MGGEDTPYPHWAELVDACEDYAALSGWRFVLSDFMRLDDASAPDDAHASDRDKQEAEARRRAMPVALTFADDVRALAALPLSAREDSPFYGEFLLCQRLVASEAIFNSMVATCNALGVMPKAEEMPASGGEPDTAYQDTSRPLPAIAQCLANALAARERHPHLGVQRKDRLLHASFIVDFGIEHGLAELKDKTSEGMLRDFLERVKEWGGDDAFSQDLVRSLVMDELGGEEDGRRGGKSRSPALREAALDWFERNKTTALVGGAILAGALGIFVAGATILAAGARNKR
mmetsp:Transcript_18435/g.49574  ORF Transcript_18435/g.49574 Transcript_18435/m.49574 type:complete len:289 (+) Transcript_18435:112-978(+)